MPGEGVGQKTARELASASHGAAWEAGAQRFRPGHMLML